MSVQAVTSPNPTTFERWKDQLSKIDWKVHSLVVLGYLLVGIGIALACASPFIAFVIHPMIGASAPVFFLAGGAAALQESKKKLSSNKLLPPIPPLRGLPNAKAGNCWLNSFTQLLLHVPAFRKKIEELLVESQSWKNKIHQTFNPRGWLYPFLDFYKRYHKGESVDPQQLRDWLSQHIDVSPVESVQEEPLLFCDYFFKQARHHLPLEMQIMTTNPKKEDSKISTTSPSYYFSLGSLLDGENNSLPDAFKKYFHFFQKRGSEQDEIERFLKDPPEDFSVYLDQAALLGQKVVRKVQDAMEFSLQASQIGKKTKYRCDGFSRHIGSTAKAGHYIAYFYENGHWYEASDDVIKWINPQQAEQHLSTAWFIHYAKSV